MRVAFVCYWNLDVEDGVGMKIREQVAQWRRAGHTVELFAIGPAAPVERWRRSRAVAAQVARFDPHVVYLRYDLYLPPIWLLARRFRTVVEVNTLDRAEAGLRARRRHATVALNELNRRLVFGAADGFVAVTTELARLAADGRRPVEVVANGIDLESIAPVAPPPPGGPPSLVFLGTARQAWHGVDKIARLAELLPGARFDVVGYTREELGFEPPPNLTVHPRLTRAEYEPIVARADVALGTLALHRKRMDEACPLKVREYLAYGLPVVIGYRDTDFPDGDPWYLLRLPNEELNVERHADEIERFLMRMQGRRVARDEVETRIDSAAKESRRVEFLERIAGHASSAER